MAKKTKVSSSKAESAPAKKVAAKRVDGKMKTNRVWPRLSGTCDFKAEKGKVLPVMVGPKSLLRIDESRWASVNMDAISYSSKNIIKRALMDGDIKCADKAPQGGR